MASKFGRWEKHEKAEDLAKDLTSTVDHLRALAKPRLEREKRLMRLYNPDPSGNLTDLIGYLRRDFPEFNLVRQGVDTLLAHIASTKYLPRYLITEASWDKQRTARLRRRVLEGQIEDRNVASVMAMAALDAYVLGTGHLVGFVDEDGPNLERALPGEIVVDPYSAVSGSPQKVYRRRAIPLEYLIEEYPEIPEGVLADCAKATDSDRALLYLPRDATVTDIRVDEAWVAPTKNGPGRHVVTTSRKVLLDEPWDYEIPVIPVYYQKRQVGYWGIGIGEIAQSEQIRLDRLLKRIDDVQTIDSTLYVVASSPQQRFSAEAMPGTPARIIRATGGAPPQFQVFRGRSADLTQEVDRIRERFLSVMGISQMAAENKKPAGVSSAIGQRTFEDITARRQKQIADNFKDAWLGVIKCLENLNAYAQAKNDDYSVVARTTRGLVPLDKTVKWTDAHIDRNSYRLSLQLVSDTPHTIGGRVEALTEWIASGYVSRPYSQKQLLETPSEELVQADYADLDYVMWQVETILDGGLAAPEPYQNVELAADTVRRIYLNVKSSGAPEDVLARLRKFIDEALPQPTPQLPSPQAIPPGGLPPDGTSAPDPMEQALLSQAI